MEYAFITICGCQRTLDTNCGGGIIIALFKNIA